MILALEQDIVLAGAPAARNLPWAQAAPLLPGYQVEILLPDGKRVWGRALTTSPDSLVVDVEWTSNRTLHPRGLTIIPSASLSVIKRRRPGRTPKGDQGEDAQAAGAALGAVATIPLGLSLGEGEKASKLWAPLFLAGGAVAGVLIAHRLVNPTLVIRIVPEPSSLLNPTVSPSRNSNRGRSAQHEHG
ncbi:MAG: hypothetical protein C5B57_05640 [Blastocatellia bacterium]|nr:MAG: hypothetical protein C5B57_05640 [Blastocatellia bacterium]